MPPPSFFGKKCGGMQAYDGELYCFGKAFKYIKE
jgi:hypothetical protein